MKKLTVLLALAVTLALSLLAATAQAGQNTGWPCSYRGQMIPYGHSAMLCASESGNAPFFWFLL